MSTLCVTSTRGASDADWLDAIPGEGGDVIEIPLLLSGKQMSALEQAAFVRGLTAGEMVRHLLREFIERQPIHSD